MIRYSVAVLLLATPLLLTNVEAGQRSPTPFQIAAADQIHPECTKNKRQRRCTCAKDVGASFNARGGFFVSERMRPSFELCMQKHGWPLES